MEPSKDLHVVIIGGGITGLLLAQGLKLRNIAYTVYEEEESASYYRPREWGMSIQWALPMIPSLLPATLLQKIQSASVDEHYVFPETGNSMPVYNVETGTLMKDVPLVNMIRVSRRRLRALCAEGIDVQYKKKLARIEVDARDARPKAIFEDGSSATGNVLVGADGANSVVRRCVFTAPDGISQKIPYGGINMHVCFKDANIAKFLRGYLSPIQAIGVHPKGYWLWLSVQDVLDPENPAAWNFQLQWTWKVDPQNDTLNELNLAELKIEAASFAEPFKTAWLNIPDGTRVPENRISVWQPRAIQDPLYSGKVALVGDAGHAMSFHRGQGLNHGIADAVKLCEALQLIRESQWPLKQAVKAYEQEMVKRAGEEVEISMTNTEMMHDWYRLIESPFMQRGGDKNK